MVTRKLDPTIHDATRCGEARSWRNGKQPRRLRFASAPAVASLFFRHFPILRPRLPMGTPFS